MQKTTPQIVCLLNNRGQIVQAGQGAEAGHTDAPSSEQPASIHELLHPNCENPTCHLGETWHNIWSTVLETGVYTAEFFDPELKTYLEFSVHPLVPTGEAAQSREAGPFAVVTVRDISDRKQQEELARSGELRYRHLAESISDYIYTVTVEQGKAVATQHSPRCEAITGYTVEEFDENPDLWFEMIFGEDRPAVLEFNRNILAGQPVPALEHRIVRRDGAVRWIRNTPVSYYDKQGRLVAWEGVITDITPRRTVTQARERMGGRLQRELLERTQAERRARELTRKLFMLQYASAALTSSLDSTFVLETVTRNMNDLLTVECCIIFEWNQDDRTIAELARSAPSGWFDDRSSPEVIDLADFPLASQALVQRQVQHILPEHDGEGISGIPYRPKHEVNLLLLLPMEYREKITGLVMMLGSRAKELLRRDDLALLQLMANQAASAIENARLYQSVEQQLEETRRIDKALRESEARYRILLNAIPDLIFRINRQGIFLDYSRGEAIELFASPDDFLGKPLSAFLPSDVAELALQAIEEAIRTGSLQTFDYQLPMPTGPREYEARISRFSEDEAVTIVRDITERKQVERQIIHAERLAALGRLAASLAHEMNNPLQAIQSNLDLILDYSLSPEREKKHLRIIQHEVTRLAHTLKQVLDFARAPALPARSVDVVGLVEQMLELTTKELQNNGIEVETNFQPVPHVMVVPQQLGQVFLNLILNAVEAMPGGGQLQVTVQSEEDQVVVSFANSGPPIPANIMAHIFDPFFSTKNEGVGLGLWISYNLVERHGGKLLVENSSYDQRVIFTVRIPQFTPQPASFDQPTTIRHEAAT
jgi:PAS domain S-box-containing protein